MLHRLSINDNFLAEEGAINPGIEDVLDNVGIMFVLRGAVAQKCCDARVGKEFLETWNDREVDKFLTTPIVCIESGFLAERTQEEFKVFSYQVFITCEAIESVLLFDHDFLILLNSKDRSTPFNRRKNVLGQKC